MKNTHFITERYLFKQKFKQKNYMLEYKQADGKNTQ